MRIFLYLFRVTFLFAAGLWTYVVLISVRILKDFAECYAFIPRYDQKCWTNTWIQDFGLFFSLLMCYFMESMLPPWVYVVNRILFFFLHCLRTILLLHICSSNLFTFCFSSGSWLSNFLLWAKERTKCHNVNRDGICHVWEK